MRIQSLEVGVKAKTQASTIRVIEHRRTEKQTIGRYANRLLWILGVGSLFCLLYFVTNAKAGRSNSDSLVFLVFSSLSHAK